MPCALCGHTHFPDTGHFASLAVTPTDVADDGMITAILIAPGELKNKGLYLPDDVAPLAAQLFVGKPVFLDHGASPNPNTRPDNRRIGEIDSVWTEGGAVYGKFKVASESVRGILRGLKDMGLGGMSAVIQYLASDNGVISAIVGVASVDVVLTPASEGARILQADQHEHQPNADTDLSWFEKAWQFFAALPLTTRQSPAPAPAEPATSEPTEEIIMDEALKAALDAMQAAIIANNKTATDALDAKIEAQTVSLALTAAAVADMIKKQMNAEMAGFRKKMMKDKMSADLPDMPSESLDSLVDALYAQRVDDETEEAMMSRMDIIVGPLREFAAAQKAALTATAEVEAAAAATAAEEAAAAAVAADNDATKITLPIPIPLPTQLTAQLAEVAGATVPAATDALSAFIKQYDKPVEKDEHGRAVVASNGNGSAA